MSRQSNIELTTRYFSAMSKGEWATVEGMYHDDIVLHMLGSTPASGRLEGKAMVTDELIAQQVHGALVPEAMHFAKRWKIMCGDDERVCVIMEGGGPTRSGDRYDQTYCEVLRFKDGRIIEMHAFFDTALAERALFNNPLKVARNGPEKPLTF